MLMKLTIFTLLITAPAMAIQQSTPTPELLPLGRDKWGDLKCGFVALPGLTMTDGRYHTANFEVHSRDRGGATYLSASLAPGFTAARWQGLTVTSRVVVSSDALVRRQPVSATITIDGKTSAIPSYISHDPEGPASQFAVGLKKIADEMPRVSELGAGSVLVVRLFDAAGSEISSDTIDISGLRSAPSLLNAANWKCPATRGS